MTERPWARLHRETLHTDRWRRLYRDRVRIHTGEEVTYSLAECPAAAFIVPLTDRGDIVLVRQYRYPVDRWIWEVPAGAIEDEAPIETAHRELLEEVGGTARDVVQLGLFYAAAAHLHLACHAFLATGVTLGAFQRESTELIEIRALPAEEAFAMARTGGLNEAQSALAVLMAEPLIRARLGASR